MEIELQGGTRRWRHVKRIDADAPAPKPRGPYKKRAA
jgi:hypothetical protein